MGRYREALDEMRAAVALDPLNATTRGGGLALTALGAREYALAAAEARLAATRAPGVSDWRVIEGLALMLDGKPDQCVAMKLPEPVTAICLRRLGRVAEAAAIIDRLTPLAERTPLEVHTLGFLGVYQAELGDAAGTIRWLKKAHEVSPTGFDFRYYSSGLFDKVKGDPVFQRGLDQILTRIRARFS